jgi:TonB family protein
VAKQVWLGRSGYVVSAALHALIFAGIPDSSLARDKAPEPTVVEFEAVAPKPEPEPEIEPEPEPEPTLEPVVQETVVVESQTEVVDEVAPAVEPELAPPELTGMTLLADGEGPFSAEAGSGRVRRGAIRAGTSQPAPVRRVVRRAPKPKPAKPAPPTAIPVAQLSKKPVPPDLGSALKRNYPSEARRQGRAGEAKVRARIEASGSIRLAKVAFESENGFGKACRTTLLRSKWSAPLDKKGKPVATWISYRCKFRID